MPCTTISVSSAGNAGERERSTLNVAVSRPLLVRMSSQHTMTCEGLLGAAPSSAMMTSRRRNSIWLPGRHQRRVLGADAAAGQRGVDVQRDLELALLHLVLVHEGRQPALVHLRLVPD